PIFFIQFLSDKEKLIRNTLGRVPAYGSASSNLLRSIPLAGKPPVPPDLLKLRIYVFHPRPLAGEGRG
ncbi:MAG: hypothetical protein ACKVT0_20335, partial [Planctomycetaceae bacterium]